MLTEDHVMRLINQAIAALLKARSEEDRRV
jgi:hypothetical protein